MTLLLKELAAASAVESHVLGPTISLVASLVALPVSIASTIHRQDGFSIHQADLLSFLAALGEPLYSVTTDPRTSDWPTEIPDSTKSEDLGRLLPVRQPLLHIVIGVDLSEPNDLDILDSLLYTPLPIDLHVVPIVSSSASPSQILTKCFSTVYQGPADLVRLRDFLRSLVDFAGIRKDRWSTVREREAVMACQLFTKELPIVSAWLEDEDYSHVSDLERKLNLSASTVIINGQRSDNVTIEKLFALLVQHQHAVLIGVDRQHDEL